MIDSTNPRVMADNIRHLKGSALADETSISQNAVNISKLQTYSEEESDTGRVWIDGKPIYRKVYEVTALPNNTSENIPHGISDVGEVINLYGVSKMSPSKIAFVFPYSTRILLRYSATNIVVVTTADYSDQGAYLFFEYTKADPESLASPSPENDTRSIEDPEISDPIERSEEPSDEIIEEPIEEPVKKTTRKKATTTE